MKKIIIGGGALLAAIIASTISINKHVDILAINIAKQIETTNVLQNEIRDRQARRPNLLTRTYEKFAKNRDMQKEYERLIKGLDDESILTVNNVLARDFANQKKAPVMYDLDEVKQFYKMKAEFQPYKLSEECFVWKNYKLPINSFERSVFYYDNGAPNLRNKKRFKSKAIIDVGGYIGDSAIVLAKYTTDKVYSFEPSSENIKLMQKTIKLNNLESSIVPVQKGLGLKQETLYMSKRISSGLKTISEKIDNTEAIEIITLDDYVKENNLQVGLIKVDIEGAEQDFLKGAEQTIKTQRPSLLLSIYHNAADFFQIKPMIESWNLGYKFRIVKCIDGHASGETLLVAEVPEEGE